MNPAAGGDGSPDPRPAPPAPACTGSAPRTGSPARTGLAVRARLARMPPLFVALGLQLLAALAVGWILRAAGLGVPLLVAAAASGLLAALLAALAGLERWWWPIQVLFLPALVLLLALQLPAWTWASGALALLLVYWSTYRTRVPLFLSGPQTWRALEELLPAAASGRAPRFIDLGCGVGGLILHLARARPDVTVHGIELAPLPALVSRLRIALARLPNASASWGSFWDRDLSGYDVVFAFLSPVPMPRLWAQLRAQMRTGTLFVSSSFPVPGITPERCIEVEDRKRATLYLYRL